ncbi:hypothetical protein ETB97_011226, partial [Aspergillus alliaceus]
MEEDIQLPMSWHNTGSLPSIRAVLGSTLLDSTASNRPLISSCQFKTKYSSIDRREAEEHFGQQPSEETDVRGS